MESFSTLNSNLKSIQASIATYLAPKAHLEKPSASTKSIITALSLAAVRILVTKLPEWAKQTHW